MQQDPYSNQHYSNPQQYSPWSQEHTAGPVPVSAGSHLSYPPNNNWQHTGSTFIPNDSNMDNNEVIDMSDPVDPGTGRIQMFCPTNPRVSVARLTQRNKNKHRRLFDGQSGALKASNNPAGNSLLQDLQ
jgi:hypothetical protein